MQKILAVMCTVAALFVLWVGAGLMVIRAVNQPAESRSEVYLYTLKSRNNRAVLYTADGEEVAQYAVYVNLLPKQDRKRLEEGIEIKDRAELSSVLEDFGL